jgi:hypothetical protein
VATVGLNLEFASSSGLKKLVLKSIRKQINISTLDTALIAK